MKNFKIGDKITRVPLIQGGMGVGISLGRLAGSVAKAGGVGIISTAQIGYREEDFDRNPAAANERAIVGEMKKAQVPKQDLRFGQIKRRKSVHLDLRLSATQRIYFNMDFGKKQKGMFISAGRSFEFQRKEGF